MNNAALHLYCFPYAGGGSAVYRDWQRALGSSVCVVALELPGRGTRFRERPLAELSALVTTLAAELGPRLEKPFAFFGHSMGALLAYALTHRLAAAAQPLPERLIASGFAAPHRPRNGPTTYDLPDEQLLGHLAALGSLTPELLRERELLQFRLPVLRADLAVCDTRVPFDALPLPVPISVFGGEQDHMVSLDDFRAWRANTSREFELKLFPGGHFYFQDSNSGFLPALAARLDATVRAYEAGRNRGL